jgi:hypothetical protein
MLAMNCMGSAYAQKVVSGSKELPLEINLLLDSVQSSGTESFEKILPLVMNIDLYARSMSKEDIFLIGKIEVYKTLLKNYATANKTPIDGVTVAKLRTAINKSKDNFVKWFLQALLKDSLDLTSSPVYKEFLLQKNSNLKVEKLEYRKLEKKAELIQFWVAKINPENMEALTNELTPKMIEALKNIQNSFYLMAKEASMTPMAQSLKSEDELKFFSVQNAVPVKTEKPVATGQKSVEDILAPITDTAPLDLPKPTQENWLEEENAPPALQNLPKPNNDADWLQDF